MSIPHTTQTDRVLDLARQVGVLRPRDVASQGIHAEVLRRLVDTGALLRVAHGLYMHPDFEPTAHHTLVEVTALVPKAVVNLLSALAFHELTDEVPSAVWIAVPQGSQTPTIGVARLELTRTAPRFLAYGVEHHTLEGLDVPITSPARTVVDCFRFRSRVGLDTAIAALRDFNQRYRTGRSELWETARFCRASTVMRPYIEALS